MSFSSQAKDEICRHETTSRCCMLSELAAVLITEGAFDLKKSKNESIKVVTENAAFARRVFSTGKKLFNLTFKLAVRKNSKQRNAKSNASTKKHVTYIIDMTELKTKKDSLIALGLWSTKEGLTELPIFERLSQKLLDSSNSNKDCCKKAFLRGAFLEAGTVCDPEKSYHLEINTDRRAVSELICSIMEEMSFKAKILVRKGTFVVYLKEGEDIVNFLNLTGAHTSLMAYENVRILKEMRNNVNRVVNCETANLQKTVNAAYRQVENIGYIRENIGFKKIPENLRVIADLRVKYPDLNLKELGELLTPPLGKSGVNHRLKKLDKIAENLRQIREV